MTCTFFGHKNTPDKVKPILREIIIELIETKGVTEFFVGNHGCFDGMVRRTLKELKVIYPEIDYSVVLAYLPKEKDEYGFDDYTDTVFPEGFELVHPKYAIVKRNRWMVEQSDYVVTYVERSFGGAVRFKELAERKGKIVINIPDLNFYRLSCIKMQWGD